VLNPSNSLRKSIRSSEAHKSDFNTGSSVSGPTLTVRPTKEKSRNFHRFRSADKMYRYHVSIIDYLQKWDCNKLSEQTLKTYVL